MKVSVIDMMIAGENIKEKVENAAKYGFDGIEVFVGGDSSLREIERQVKQCAHGTGLDVLQVVLLREAWYSPMKDNQDLKKKISTQKEYIELSANVGGHLSQVVPEYGPQLVLLGGMSKLTAEEEKYLMDFLTETADFARQFDILLVVDVINRYETHYFRRLEELAGTCTKLQRSNVKAIFDSFHVHLEEPDTTKAIEAAGQLIGHVHLADSNRSLPGDGHIDFESEFRSLKKVGYDGYMSFEVQTDFIPDANTQLPKAIQYVREVWNRS